MLAALGDIRRSFFKLPKHKRSREIAVDLGFTTVVFDEIGRRRFQRNLLPEPSTRRALFESYGLEHLLQESIDIGFLDHILDIVARNQGYLVATPQATLVQHTSTCMASFPNAANSTVNLFFAQPTLANNCLILAMQYDNANTGVAASVSDDAGNTYTKLVGGSTISGVSLEIWVKTGAAAGARKVTVTFTGGPAINIPSCAALSEFYNVATASASDGTAAPVRVSNPWQPGVITTTQANDLIYQFGAQDSVNGGGAWWGGQTFANCNFKADDSGTGGTRFQLLHTDISDGSAAQYAIQKVAGDINPAINLTNAGNGTSGATLAVALKSAAAGTAPSATATVIRRAYFYTVWGTATNSFRVQYQCEGNLSIALWDGYSGSTSKCTVSSIVDNANNTWNNRDTAEQSTNQTGAAFFDMQILDSFVSGAGNLLMTFNLAANQAGTTLTLLDVVNGGAFDKAAHTISTVTSNPATFTTVSITPAQSGGLVIYNENQDIGTINNVTINTANTCCFMVPYYPEQSGGFTKWTEDKGIAAVFPTSTSQITFTAVCTAAPGAWASVAASYLPFSAPAADAPRFVPYIRR